MGGRGLLVLAIVAALVWAPPTASAATNLLDRAETSPTSGTTSTTFRLRVSYEGRFPALRVHVAVADRTLVLSLVSGTSTDGTWEASLQLPAGVWPVVFTAVAERGNSPTLAGPTLTVLEPGVSSTPPPSDGEPENGPEDAPRHAPEAQGQTAAPDPTGGTAPGGDASAANADPSDPPMTAEPLAPATGSPPSTGGGAGSDGGTADRGDGTLGEVTAADASDVPGAMAHERTVADDGDAAPLGPVRPASTESEAVVDDGLLDDALRIAAVWAAALLVVGSVMLGLLVRRRRREAADAEALAIAAETEALLERRALRRAHVLMPEDPIVASMRLDEPPPIARRADRRRERRRDREKR